LSCWVVCVGGCGGRGLLCGALCLRRAVWCVLLRGGGTRALPTAPVYEPPRKQNQLAFQAVLAGPRQWRARVGSIDRPGGMTSSGLETSRVFAAHAANERR
jgi:hypothetical protein